MLDELVRIAFDPAWNAQNHDLIMGVVVGALLVSGVGLPLPEDIPLMLSGFTTFMQADRTFVFSDYLATFVIVTTPILFGDLTAYALGRQFGFGLAQRSRFLKRLLAEKRLARVRRWYEEYGSFTVFLARQVAGVRFVAFYTAGTMQMSIVRFVIWDFLGCLVSVPVWLALGTLAARYGREWMEVAARNVGVVFVLSAATLGVALYLYDRRRRRLRAAAGEPEPPD